MVEEKETMIQITTNQDAQEDMDMEEVEHHRPHHQDMPLLLHHNSLNLKEEEDSSQLNQFHGRANAKTLIRSYNDSPRISVTLRTQVLMRDICKS